MSLWSSEQDVVLMAMECFALMNEEASLLMTLDGCNPIHPAPLYTAYYKFGREGQQVTTGRTALQKKIMAILRQVDIATPGNLEVCAYMVLKHGSMNGFEWQFICVIFIDSNFYKN